MIEKIDNYFKNNYQNIIKFIISIFLFLYKDSFSKIPIYIFKIKTVEPYTLTYICLSIFSSICTFIILFFLYKKDLINEWEKFKNNKSDIFDISLKCWFIGLIVMGSTNLLIGLIAKTDTSMNEQAIRTMIKVNPILMLFSTTIMAPIIEELLFRKSYRVVFKNKWIFICLSGIIFGSLHVIGSVNNVLEYLYIIPYSSLGIALAYMYYKTDTIFSSISIHMIHNFLMTIINIVMIGFIL